MVLWGGIALFLVAFFVVPKVLAWWLGYVCENVPVPSSFEQRVQGTQVRTWEHPTEGTQVEVSQVDVATRQR
jgi:hypothetical protein